MRVLVDQKELMVGGPIAVPSITQIGKTPTPEDGLAINGRFILPVVDGVEFQVESDSYVLPIDGDDISSQAFGYLLATFPMYGHIFFNPFLTYEDLESDGGVDYTKTFRDNSSSPPDPPVYHSPRLQTGRGISEGSDAGLFPTHTALLPINDKLLTGEDRPGLMVTREIDITPYTGSAGTDEFCLYWKLFDFEVSEDHAGDYGVVGDNTPAIRRVFETDPEPDDLTVYISPDNGIHWCEAGFLEPVAFTLKTTSIRLAFLNRGDSKIYIANYAAMF